MDDSSISYCRPEIVVEFDLIVSAGPSGVEQDLLDPLLADALGLDSPLN
jgi:hypothetical protein